MFKIIMIFKNQRLLPVFSLQNEGVEVGQPESSASLHFGMKSTHSVPQKRACELM